MSSIRKQRPSSSYVPYPALILNHEPLEALGLIWGTRPDEVPPKVVMTRANWDKLVAAIRKTEAQGKHALAAPNAPHRAIAFLGQTWRDNPLVAPPPDAAQEHPAGRPYRYRPKRPHRFAHLIALPVDQALAQARAEHETRVASGDHDPEESMETLIDALEAIKRAAANRVEPKPLPVLEGRDPPTPTELKQATREIMARGIQPSRPTSPSIKRTVPAKRSANPAPPFTMESVREADYTSYPAEILEHAVLDSLGLVYGTAPDETPPKVIMSRRDWGKLLRDGRVKQAIRFFGDVPVAT